MATYTTTDGRRITSTKNDDGTKTKNIVNADGTKSTEIYNPKTRTSTPGPMNPNTTISNPIQSPLPANEIQPAPTVDLPEPTAIEAAQANTNSIQGEVATAKNNLNTVLNSQRAEIQKEIDDLQKEQDIALKEGKELTTPFREKLEEKERKRLKIDENFEANQKLTNELESLLTQSNELINIATGRQVSGKILDKSVSKTLADVQARAGVVQAVMSARNDQIAVANNMIDRTVEAIVADRNDELSYYNTIIGLTDSKLINLSAEKYKIATTERDQAIKDVDSAQATADYVKGLMLNPETAQFMADAGVSLTDSVDEIQEKMGVQANVQEAIDMRNSLVDAGYDISAVPVPGGIEVEAGGQTLYAKVRKGSELDLRLEGQKANIAQSYASARASNASAARAETGRMLDLAAAGDPVAISKLGLTMPDTNAAPSPTLIAYASEYAANGTLPSASSLPKGVTVGDVAELARSLPKPDGAVVSTNTGVMSKALSAAERDGVTAMNEIVNVTLPAMAAKWEDVQRTNFGGTGILGGISSKIIPSKAMTEYETLAGEFAKKLQKARSGAAVSEQEAAYYSSLLPGAFNTPFFVGTPGDRKIESMRTAMTQDFDNLLDSKQLSVYGYSQVPGVDEGTSFTVGEVIVNEYGQEGLVQPDGSVTLINP